MPTQRAIIDALSVGERHGQNLADPVDLTRCRCKSGGRWSSSDEYGEVLNQPRDTAIFWSPAENNELGTCNRINEYVWSDPERIHPITKERAAGFD